MVIRQAALAASHSFCRDRALVRRPWNYVNLRWLRREALSQVDDRRTYVSTLSGLLRDDPQLNSFLYYEAPLLPWGVSAAARWLHPGAKVIVARADDPAARKVLAQP